MSAASKKTREQAAQPGAPDALPEGLEVWLDDVAVGPIAHMGRLHRVGADTIRFEYVRISRIVTGHFTDRDRSEGG